MNNFSVLSARDYEPKGSNYGDCTIIDTNSELVVYDCGCEEHAQRVEQYMKDNGYDKVIVVLSHNDADHFNGIPYLVENNLVSKIYAQLYLKHKDKIKELMNDGRVTNKSLSERIKTDYDNISSLSGKAELIDAIELQEIVSGVSIVGPDKDYTLEAIAKELKNSEGDTMDCETVINASSVQLSVDIKDKKLLLCGDCSFESIKDKLFEYKIIQLPHHGKAETAEKIFDEKTGENDVVYIVSDNTGNTNGGSSKLKSAGKQVKNTLKGDIKYPESSSNTTFKVTRTLGEYEMGWFYR